MIRPKKHIEHIYRTPAVEKSRLDSIRMDKNEFLPCWPAEWFRETINRLRPEHFSVHPELATLYGKLSCVLGLKDSNLVVTAGSDAAIRAAFEVFVEPGDEVIILSPTFAMYYVYSQIYNSRLVEIHYDENLAISFHQILSAINNKTKLIAIANPNSPTGTVIPRDELVKITEKASELGCTVLIDEAYYPFYEGSMMDLVEKFDNLIVTRTFSKAAGLAGMRVGFLVGNEKIARMLFAVKPMYEITAVSVFLAEYVLDNYDRVFEYAKQTREGKDYLAKYFQEKGYEVFKGHANFLHVDFGSRRSETIKHLLNNKVLFKDSFTHPSLKRFSRFTIGPRESLTPLIDIFNNMDRKA